MLESALRSLIPAIVSTFDKLIEGEPYHFERWADSSSVPCLYYWFYSKDKSRRNKKRVPVPEIRAALEKLQNAGALDRKSFEATCPISHSAGDCGFAVVGRVLEALGTAKFSGRSGFVLTDARKAKDLLEKGL